MDNQREKERDRSRRGDRPSRFSDATRDRSGDRDRSDGKRLFVSNIPYEFRWAELKDLFKDKVGDVAYVELFNDENGKPRGCGVVEFTNSEAMKKALFVMHRYELNGRKLVLKEETALLIALRSCDVATERCVCVDTLNKYLLVGSERQRRGIGCDCNI